MADYVRRLVSGNKARFKDPSLNVELDLVYITPRVIIMGYPADGFESFYRNKRADAKRFLDARHGKNYWVFNLCPLRENSYEKEVFEGRVTRFPFPDHHAPPLALMPLVAREMHAWLDGNPERVVVIHCKAGKGRSGTMACTYLLTLISGSDAASQTKDALNQLPDDLDSTTHVPTSQRFHPPDSTGSRDPMETSPLYDEGSGLPISTSPQALSPSTTFTANPERSFTDALKGVLDLHTSKRMKPASPTRTPDIVDEPKKQKQGVSIPSQRRYLHYWALILNGEAPKDILNTGPHSSEIKPLVRINQIRVRMREPGGVKLGLVRAANVVLDKAVEYKNKHKKKDDASSSQSDTPGDSRAFASGANRLWASIARYDDALIDFLEGLERKTRYMEKAWPGHESRFKGRNEGDELEHEDLATVDGELRALFDEEGTWDKEKMVRSFARFGLKPSTGTAAASTSESVIVHDFERRTSDDDQEDKEKAVHEYVLGLVSDKRRHKHSVPPQEALSTVEQPIPGISVAESEKTATEVGENAKHKRSHSADSSDYEVEDRFEASSVASSALSSPLDRASPLPKAAKGLDTEKGLVVEASREVRVKLYVGQVFVGWMWFIPSFHMPQPPPSSSTSTPQTKTRATLHLKRKDLDFPLGLGTAIVDVNIDMEWVAPLPSPTSPGDAADQVHPDSLGKVTSSMANTSIDSREGGVGVGIAQVVNALQGGPGEGGGGAGGEGGVREAVEVGQSKGV